jgi:hypothetical protein
MPRARIAVCEVAPPTSVTKEAKFWSLKAITSDGERSCATTISVSPLLPFGALSVVWSPRPTSSRTTRSTT